MQSTKTSGFENTGKDTPVKRPFLFLFDVGKHVQLTLRWKDRVCI